MMLITTPKLSGGIVLFLLSIAICPNVLWSIPTFPFEFSGSSTLHLTKSVSSLLQQFNWCHLQIYQDICSNHQDYNTLYRIFHYFHENTVSYSIYKNVSSLEKSWNDVEHTFIQKAACYLHIFIEEQHWGSNVSSLVSLISQESWRFNPDYVIFLAETSANNLKIKSLSRPVSRSHYVILNMSDVFLINAATKGHKLVSQVGTLAEETTKYFINLNMNQNLIRSELIKRELGTIKTCDYKTKNGIRSRPPTVEECIFNDLGEKLNFSYRTTGKIRYAMVKRRQPMSMNYLNGEIKIHRRQVIELGFVYDQWGYFVAKENLQKYDTALVGPFDILIWISLLLSLLGLTLVFVAILYYSRTNTSGFGANEKLFKLFFSIK